MGGDPTTFNLGIALGSAWIVAIASLVFSTKHINKRISSFLMDWRLFIVITFPIILLLFSSRSCLIAAVLVAAILVAYNFQVSQRTKVGLLIGSVCLISIIYSFIPEERKSLLNELPAAINYINNFADFSGAYIPKDDSMLARIIIYKETLRLFWESPFFGIGATNFGLLYLGEEAEFASPHSQIAHVLAELGLIGFFLFAMVIYNIIRTYHRSKIIKDGRNHAVIGALFAVWLFFFFIGQFSGNIYYDYHIFLLTGLLASNISVATLGFSFRGDTLWT
jgi:O-antigen ligase